MTIAVLALFCGVVVGLIMGILGAGGSVLTVPALVYVFGQSPHDATTASLVIVAAAALAGLMGHARAGRVRWKPGILFALVGTAGSFLGSRLSRSVDGRYLLLAFAGLILVVAVVMVRRKSAPAGMPAHKSAKRYSSKQLATIVIAASGVGLLTGFFGVGGGFVVVPALTLLLGFGMSDAIGTSLLVIVVNTLTALVSRGSLQFDRGVVLPFAAAAIVTAIVGSAVGGKIPAARLKNGFAVMLIAVGLYVAIQAIHGLVTG